MGGSWPRSGAPRTGTEIDDDLLEVVREKLGCWSREGSEAGEKVKWFRLDDVFHRGRLGSRDPILLLQPENTASDPCRLFFCLGLPLKSVSLRNPKS